MSIIFTLILFILLFIVFMKIFSNFKNKQTVMKNRTTAALLALFLGGFGIHQFYLGKSGKGVLYLLFCWTLIPAIIAFIDFIILITMNDELFNNKYNDSIIVNNNTQSYKTIEKDYYPKTENEAIVGLLLKIAQSDGKIDLEETSLIVTIMKDIYGCDIESEMKYYNLGFVVNENKHDLINKYINFIKDKNKLLNSLIAICLAVDEKVDLTEMSFLVYVANKSNIDTSNIDIVIEQLSQNYK